MVIDNEIIKKVLPKVIAWRHVLHQHPELSFQEYKTTAYIIEQIEKLPGVTIERPMETGLIASFSCDTPGPTIALRADIDALPVTEETVLPFTSVNEGVMHACGHDTHAALLLGALYVLYESRHRLRGKFKFLFQPAEEKFPGGARALIAAGALDDVDAIIGQHTDPRYKVGQIAAKTGYISANTDCFTITIAGRGGHASQPQFCLDPLVVGAQIVTALQQIVARFVAPSDAAVVSTTMFHCGTADNIIADTATLAGTVRTHSQETRDTIEGLIKNIVHHYADSVGLTGTVAYRRGYDGTLNTTVYTEAVMDLARELYGDDGACMMGTNMGGEDFAYYLQKVPGCFYHFGITTKDSDTFYPNHNAKFYVDEESFEAALTVLAEGALRFQDIVEKE